MCALMTVGEGDQGGGGGGLDDYRRRVAHFWQTNC